MEDIVIRKIAWDCGYAFYGHNLRSIVSYVKAYADKRGLFPEIVLREYTEKMRIVISMIHEKLKEGSPVLEVGCGGGYYLERIRDCYNYLFLIGLDISMKAIRERKTNGEKFSNIEFVEADATYLPFKEGVFDCVYSSETLEHILHIEKFFDEAFRIMKKGALLVALTPNGARINPILLLAAPLLMFNKVKKKNITEAKIKEPPKPYDKALSASKLRHLSRQKGFHAVNVRFFFHFPPHSCFAKELNLSKRIYNLFRLISPILRILLKPYGQLLILSAEKTLRDKVGCRYEGSIYL